MGPRLGATCDNVFTDKPVDYGPQEWDRRRVGRISLPSSLFANWKAALLKFCNDTGRCRVEEEEAVEEIGKKLERLNKRKKGLMMDYGISSEFSDEGFSEEKDLSEE